MKLDFMDDGCDIEGFPIEEEDQFNGLTYEQFFTYKDNLHRLYYLITYGYDKTEYWLVHTLAEQSGDSKESWFSFVKGSLFIPVIKSQTEEQSFDITHKMRVFERIANKIVWEFQTNKEEIVNEFVW